MVPPVLTRDCHQLLLWGGSWPQEGCYSSRKGRRHFIQSLRKSWQKKYLIWVNYSLKKPNIYLIIGSISENKHFVLLFLNICNFFLLTFWSKELIVEDSVPVTENSVNLLTHSMAQQPHEELWPPSNEGFFIWFNFSYTYFPLEAEWWVISPSPHEQTK